MGLDMFLIKKKKDEKVEDYWDFSDELVYWRKANQVHKFFCDNGEEIEEQRTYKIKKENLKELLEICDKILTEVKTEKGKINNGYSYSKNENGEFVKTPIIEDGIVIINPEICEELLPTQSGFFFGGTEYNEYYLDDIKYTKEKLEAIIDTIDYDTEDVYYLASW